MHDDQANGRGQTDGLGETRFRGARLVRARYLPALAFPGQDDGGTGRPAGWQVECLTLRHVSRIGRPVCGEPGDQSFPVTVLISRAGAAAPSTFVASNSCIGSPGMTVLMA